MKILIISNGCVGEDKICNWLQKELSDLYSFGIESPIEKIEYTLILNPFSEINEKYSNNFYEIENSIVSLYFEDYKNMKINNGISPEKYFDFIICIQRKDFEKHAKCILYNKKKQELIDVNLIPNDWIQKYSYELYKLEKELKNDYENMLELPALQVDYEFLFNKNFPKDIYYIIAYIGFLSKHIHLVKSNLI